MIIIATVGRYETENKTKKATLAGADILRFNFSRRTPNENIEFIKVAMQTVEELHGGTKILIDMPANKIRLGDFPLKKFAVRGNEEFFCKSASFSTDCNEFIPINTETIGKKVVRDQVVTIGDGEIAIQITEIIDQDTIKIRILNTGIIEYMRTFNIPISNHRAQLIEKYKEILKLVKKVDPNFIAISYLDKELNEKIKELPEIHSLAKKTKFIIKIENENAINNIENIMQDDFYSLILLDRGELGTSIPFEKITSIQEKIIELSKKYKKPLILASQILESTIDNFIPNRAEITALDKIVKDGVWGIMLCKETGYNTRPSYTISIAKKIIAEAEKNSK